MTVFGEGDKLLQRIEGGGYFQFVYMRAFLPFGEPTRCGYLPFHAAPQPPILASVKSVESGVGQIARPTKGLNLIFPTI